MFDKYRAVNECLRLIQQRQRQGLEFPFVESALIYIKSLVLDAAQDDQTSFNRSSDFFDRLLKLVRKWDETSDSDAVSEIEKVSREIIVMLTPWPRPLKN